MLFFIKLRMCKNLVQNLSLGQLTKKHYGICKSTRFILSEFIGLNSRKIFRKLKGKYIIIIKKKIKIMAVVLKLDVKDAVRYLIDNKSYRGMRHRLKYPARGQRTHTNGKTKKKFRY